MKMKRAERGREHVAVICTHILLQYIKYPRLSQIGNSDVSVLTCPPFPSPVSFFPSPLRKTENKKEPSHLHMMLSGTCTVTKYPDRLAAVRRKINEIGAALYRIKSKYAYHRDVRTKVVSLRARRSDSLPHGVEKSSIVLQSTGEVYHVTALLGWPVGGNSLGNACTD